MKIKIMLLCILSAFLLSSCTSTGASLVGITKLAGAPIPDVVETVANLSALPDSIRRASDSRKHGTERTPKSPIEKYIVCIVDLNKGKKEEEKFYLSKEEVDVLVKGGNIDTAGDARKEQVSQCMKDEKKFNVSSAK